MVELLEQLFLEVNEGVTHIRPDKYDTTQTQQKVFDKVKESLEGFDCNMITINKNKIYEPHKHRKNKGISIGMLLGDFTGGSLMVEEDGVNVEYTTKNKWFMFDGRNLHWVLPFEGTRYSIIAYKR